jgi:hypothetical protein
LFGATIVRRRLPRRKLDAVLRDAEDVFVANGIPESFNAARYQPPLPSLIQDIPGPPTVPSALKNGTSMPPLPLRESESVSAAAMSDIVGFAQATSITVPGETGLPGASV